MTRAIVSAIFLGLFGLFLIWKGITGNVPLGFDGKRLFLKWLYILGGIVVLILPVAYLVMILLI